jgi:ascorbate-specific PTS system EIIC-type component UlaA
MADSTDKAEALDTGTKPLSRGVRSALAFLAMIGLLGTIGGSFMIQVTEHQSAVIQAADWPLSIIVIVVVAGRGDWASIIPWRRP